MIAQEQIRPGATVPEARLIPAAGRSGYVPVTSLSWLEVLRERHEVLAAQLAAAVLVPNRVREDHDASVAAWASEVRAAARSGGEPPARDVRLSAPWLVGRVDAAEMAIAALVDELLHVLREAEAAFAEREAEIDALVARVEDGYGGALIIAQRAAADEPAPPPSPLLSGAAAVRRWQRVKTHDGRSAVAVDLQELENYKRRRQERRPTEER